MKTLYLLLLLVVIIIGVLVYQKLTSVEGFQTETDTNVVEPNFCPHNMESYVDFKTSDTACCNGTVQNNICSGRPVCTLTPTATSELAACSSYLRDYYAQMAKENCFDPMPLYYEDDSQVPMISGCASKVNAKQSAPALSATACTIFPDKSNNRYKGRSCENRKMVAILQNSNFCKAVNCRASISGNGANIASVIATYTSQNGSTPVQTICESKESVIRHLRLGWDMPNDPTKQPKTGQELTDALAQVEAGTYPGMCGSVTRVKVKYLAIQGKSGKQFLAISQIVVKNKQGTNIARNPKQMWASPAFESQSNKEKAVDGNERIREFPNIYNSIETENPFLTIEFNTPTYLSDIASITIYGRKGCCKERNAGKEIKLYKGSTSGETPEQLIVWRSPVTTNAVRQTFTVS